MTAGEIIRRAIPVRFRKAETDQDPARHRFIGVAAEPFKAVFQFRVAFEQRRIGSPPHAHSQILEFMFDSPHVFPCGFHHFAQCLRAEINTLLHVTDRRLIGHAHAARVRLHCPHDATQQRRFARAVAADQADALSFRDGECDIFKNSFDAEGFREPGDFDHSHVPSPPIRRFVMAAAAAPEASPP